MKSTLPQASGESDFVTKGRCTLVGAGPGDPELLTLKAVRVLGEADVVICDDLVNPAILAHAPQALAALTLSQQSDFALVFVDLDLPGLDGFELARLLLAHHPALPLVALTARADTQAEPMARAAGMCGFLRKPVTGEMLSAAIEAALQARR